MEDRLLKLLDTEQLSSAKFADVIGVQRSSVSHILSGRNKPSFDFLQKTLKAFPHLNADWLILGEGKMYEVAGITGGGNLFDPPHIEKPAVVAIQESTPKESVSIPDSGESISSHTEEELSELPSEELKGSEIIKGMNSEKKIERVILLYTDNSFDSYNPGL